MKEERIAVLGRLASVRDHAVQISLTVFEGSGVAAPFLSSVIRAAYYVVVNYLSPFTCVACRVGSLS